MSARIRRHIRSNVIGYLALFVALSGTAYAIDGPLPGQNQVGSADIINNEVQTADIRDANLTTADIRAGAVTNGKLADSAVSTAKIADDEVRTADVLDDTLTGADIENVTRSVNLPLGSFMDLDLPGAIDFDSSNSAPSPDFVAPSGLGLFIAFDDDSGATDTQSIGSTFFVPHDYASGGTLALRVSKDAETAAAREMITCLTSVNGSLSLGGNSVEITSADNTAYTISLPEIYAVGDSAIVSCNTANFETPNDIVRIHSVEFRYTATQ